MCDLECDGSCDIWDEQERTAKTSHVCTACSETIQPGHRYRRTTVLFRGSWSRYKHCARCYAIVDALQAELEPGLFTNETLLLNCGESWESAFGFPAPPEVAALAFAIPGDAR